ncbi:ribonuclease H-like domain-containing protein [Tanacetum coccineum]
MVVEEVDPISGKPKKNKGQSSNPEDLKLGDYDPLFLHANDSNGNPIISFKLEGIENYKVLSAALKLAVLKIIKLELAMKVWNGCLEATTEKEDNDVMEVLSGLSLAEYYHKFNSQWRQYDSLVDLPKYTSDTTEKLKSHEQLIRLMQFLMVLDDVFSNVRSSILITDPLPDVKFAYATLSGDESHRVNNVHTMVNKIGFKKNSKGNNKNTKSNVNNVTTCGSSNSHMLTSDEYQKLMGLLRSSGSNTLYVSHLNIIVAYPNGTVAKVKQVGSFKLTDKLVIHDVLVVPGYHVSLLSIHKLASANKQNVVFNEMDCLIQDSTQTYLVGTSSITSGLYFLDQGKKQFNSNVKAHVMSKCLWHNRLGHIVDQVLQVLKDKIGLKDFESSPCDVCHKAKQTREPFPMSDYKTSTIGELVHLDVWGPYRVKGMEGFKYFLIIVDDFSRAVWVSILKKKD